MNHVFSALFEGALLHSSGIPIADLLEIIIAGSSDNSEVHQLFTDLKADWRASTSPHPFKLMGPFVDRQSKDKDYLIALAFTEVGAATSMIEVYWKAAAYCYLLKQHIAKANFDSEDLKFAQSLLGVLQEHHPLRGYLQEISQDQGWGRAVAGPGAETVSFEAWVKHRHFAESAKDSRPFAFEQILKKQANLIAAPEMVSPILAEWRLYSAALSALQD